MLLDLALGRVFELESEAKAFETRPVSYTAG